MARFKAIPEMTAKGMLVYAVIDTVTKEWKHVYDCFLWAEHKAEELNKNPCSTCAFSDIPFWAKKDHSEAEDDSD